MPCRSEFFANNRRVYSTSSRQKCKDCFMLYDIDKDGFLNRDEFALLCRDVFRDDEFILAIQMEHHISKLFKLLDDDKDNLISRQEFHYCWFYWLKQVLDPVTALVIVDVQNDFVDGSLNLMQCPSGHNGIDVIPVVNSLLDSVKFDHVVYSKDWHPSNHISFIDNINNYKLHSTSKISAEDAHVMDEVVFEAGADGKPLTQTLWPTHCVQESWGSELHSYLKFDKSGIIVCKGTNSLIDSYSAFWDNGKLSQSKLVHDLDGARVTDVYICGIAYDVCVGLTALHSVEHGFRTVLIEDACRGVNLDNIATMREKLKSKGVVMAQSSEVANMVRAQDCRIEVGLQAAINVALARKIVKRKQNNKKKTVFV